MKDLTKNIGKKIYVIFYSQVPCETHQYYFGIGEWEIYDYKKYGYYEIRTKDERPLGFCHRSYKGGYKGTEVPKEIKNKVDFGYRFIEQYGSVVSFAYSLKKAQMILEEMKNKYEKSKDGRKLKNVKFFFE